MGKFLIGLVTGIVVVVVAVVIAVFAIGSFRAKPAPVEESSTLVLHLTGDLPETPPVAIPTLPVSIPFLPQSTSLTVENVWTMLRHAASDSRIKAVVFEPQGTTVGWAKMQEIHADLEQFRKSGKPLIAYLRSPSTRDYYMATACSKIYMGPVDVLDMKGVAFELMFFKDILDKLGVHVYVDHAGKYKDYGDQFTRDSMSPETKQVMSSIADDIYGDLVDTVAKGRNQTPDAVRATIDDGPFLAAQAKAKGLVDELGYESQAFGDLQKALHESALKKVNESAYVDVPDSAVGQGGGEKIAFVVAEGSISRGEPEVPDTSGIESDSFDKMLNRVANDASIKGVIVRIDSPGGEVTASDDLWNAMTDLTKKKPVVISMGDDAASGGYYMAMSGAPLIAYPATMTGSIGVVFGKPDLHGLYQKVGVTKDFISRGRFALIESDYTPLTPADEEKLKQGVDADYEDFLRRVAFGRKKPVSEIEPIAQGRVWLGEQAKPIGLVDYLGGLDRAVELIKSKTGVPASGNISLVLYPPKKSLLDMLLHPDSDAEADALLSGAGLEPVREAWHDSSLRVWMRGGMLQMMPFRVEIR